MFDRISKKHKWLYYTGFLLIAGLVCTVVLDLWIFPLPIERLSRRPAHYIYSRDGKLLNLFSSSDQFWRKPVKLDEISPLLKKTVIETEDKYFYYHPGVNPISIVQAAWDNIKAGKVVRGGSTITMQIARMMDRRPRTMTSKVIEILRSLQLELHYSKNELLEIYFNLVPYGGNIEGVGAAAHFYFNKTTDKLSLSESAILTAIPASPNQFRPDLNPNKCRQRRDKILKQLCSRDIITVDERDRALEEEIPVARIDRPFMAPHLSQSLIGMCPDKAVLNTTIDYNIQNLCQNLSDIYHQTYIYRNINNLAVVVLDNHSGCLLAMIGSPDFEDELHDGQINGALALRSPGSALKPFAYGLGFEDGLITPSSIVNDIPVNYSGYTPENYDEEFHGLVTASDALINSFNVPAVNITAKVGLNKYFNLLKSGGISSLDKKYYEYGLPLVLGACEVSLLELSNLYAAVARMGEYRPVRLLSEDTTVITKQILSAETCYLLSDILSNLKHPDLPSSWEFTCDIPTVAWKTGTSYGRKDAWTIGYNPDYTVGVWAGNFNSEGSPYIVGAGIAAPLMLDIFHELTAGEEPTWFDRPDGIGERTICTRSGMPPGHNCPDTSIGLYIKAVSPTLPCDIHKTILVDKHTGYQLCRSCSFGLDIDTMAVEQWPARMSGWLLSQGQLEPMPIHNPNCRSMIAGDAPVILSPEDDALYEIRGSSPEEYQKILFSASVSSSCASVHWFLDKQWLGTCAPGEDIFYLPPKGIHELVCMDDFGRSSSIQFEIE